MPGFKEILGGKQTKGRKFKGEEAARDRRYVHWAPRGNDRKEPTGIIVPRADEKISGLNLGQGGEGT